MVKNLFRALWLSLLAACNGQIQTSQSAASSPEPVAASEPVAVSDTAQTKDTAPSFDVYYLHPDPQLKRALAIFDQILADKTVSNTHSGLFNISVWAAQVLRRQPEQTAAWCEYLYPRHQLRIAPVMSFADTPESRKCLNSLGLSDEERSKLATLGNIESMMAKPINAFALDARWASFYATGNPKYVHDIVDYLAAHADDFDTQPEKPTMEDAVRLITFNAAQWSLSSNMRQYPDINKLVGDYRNTLPADKRTKLDKALQNGKK